MKAHNQLENFKYLVESYDGKLTIADRDLISIILGEPSEVVYLSSSELAARANVHASTVVRLARKLGFKGYPDMRNRFDISLIKIQVFLILTSNAVRAFHKALILLVLLKARLLHWQR